MRKARRQGGAKVGQVAAHALQLAQRHVAEDGEGADEAMA
jgi:hypothetical protein